MDNEDSNGSGPAESNASSGGTRKSPKCGRCLSHGLVIDLKGHKRYCKRRNCYCDKCVITLTRRKRMAKKTYQDRARKQDEYKRNQGEVPDEVSPFCFLRHCLRWDLVIVIVVKNRLTLIWNTVNIMLVRILLPITI